MSGLGINHEYHRVDVTDGKVTRWPPYKLPGAISYKYGDPGSLKGFVHSVGKILNRESNTHCKPTPEYINNID